MDTTTLNNTLINASWGQYVDAMTAGLMLMATVATVFIAGVYTFAGICKRVR